MATTLKQERIESLKDLTGVFEDLSKEHNVLWFRGCGKSSYPLIPLLYRHPSIKQVKELLDLEEKITDRFKQRCVPYLNEPKTFIGLATYWEWLFRMRHAGVPTRLLDWTENPFIALYFAISSAPYDITKHPTGYEEDVAVWVLDPCAWNKKVLESINWKGGILSPTDIRLNGYEFQGDHKVMREEPANMLSTQNSPNIVVQFGVFTIFGTSMSPMEEIYVDKRYPQDCLIKLTFPREKISNLIENMLRIGYTDLIISPSLEGLANEIKRIFGYPV